MGGKLKSVAILLGQLLPKGQDAIIGEIVEQKTNAIVAATKQIAAQSDLLRKIGGFGGVSTGGPQAAPVPFVTTPKDPGDDDKIKKIPELQKLQAQREKLLNQIDNAIIKNKDYSKSLTDLIEKNREIKDVEQQRDALLKSMERHFENFKTLQSSGIIQDNGDRNLGVSRPADNRIAGKVNTKVLQPLKDDISGLNRAWKEFLRI